VTIDKDITLRSLDPNDSFYFGGTIISGDLQSSALTLTGNTAACEIAGLTIRAGSVGITGSATNATIRNCRIIDNLTHGIELSEVSNPILKHCLITANGQTGITMHQSIGRGTLICEPIIENCIIVDNGNAAIDGGEPIIIDSIIN
jgi:parallel beta-helix repeat protein